jgi:hypothetical protein
MPCQHHESARVVRALLIVGLIATLGITPPVRGSDHDDGETDSKSRNRSLTDLYVFREGDQTGVSADNANLIFVMNTNPRSVARQQYFFSQLCRYEFNVTRVTNKDATPTGIPDLSLRFTFGSVNSNSQQAITLTRVNYANGTESTTTTASAGLTTPAPDGIGNPNPTEVVTSVTVDGATLTVFAGLREDPFFFDVEQFFRVRAGALGKGPSVGFRSLDSSIDFAKGYNVNAIVVRVPITFLQQGQAATTFDVWETISAPQ